MQLPVRAIWVFHAAARAGSVSRAAEELGVTPSAVTQQIQALEVQLGVTLLTKMGRRVVLTEAGERYFATITDEIERIGEATSTIRGYRSVTTLTIRATPTLSNKWLLPRLASFLDRNPELEIRLDGTNEPTDFNRELVDLEIRHGDGRWPGLFVEGMAEETFVPACSPGMAAAGSLLFAATAAGEEPALDLYALAMLLTAPMVGIGQVATRRLFSGEPTEALGAAFVLQGAYAIGLVAIAALAYGDFAERPPAPAHTS